MRVDDRLPIPIDVSAADGEIRRATGVVRAIGETLRAPRSGTPCVAFALRIHQPARPLQFLIGTGAPFESFELSTFAIDDPYGSVLVDSGFAKFDLPFSRVTEVDADTWRVFCEECRVDPHVICDEAILEAGDTVSVVGLIERRAIRPGTNAGYRDAKDALWLVGDAENPLVITS